MANASVTASTSVRRNEAEIFTASKDKAASDLRSLSHKAYSRGLEYINHEQDQVVTPFDDDYMLLLDSRCFREFAAKAVAEIKNELKAGAPQEDESDAGEAFTWWAVLLFRAGYKAGQEGA